MNYVKKIGNDNEQIKKILLWTVKETGNVEIFQKIGFNIISEEKSEIYEIDKYEFATEVLFECRLR